ncbi:hypothetical protein SAMN04487831_11830 [Pseudobutyrivibrio sp. UC1225]|uniref:DUF5722 domain-containing protein n=1 Tax=Pseudobutyrivibrio sp. UC1225 TaxID=1798185 RepID=UPI0008E33261|nr:DUF5722 domain-containing protein [Pseudobutyrivibrio sp. UC1225]SFO31250.1 hypothetical protein SAMN04487831_11830 [Pseudobutyrivibrio sp. UC1225]
MKFFRKIASIALVLTLMVATFAAAPSLTAEAKTAKTASTAAGVAIGSVLIQGGNVNITAQGTAGSDDGMYHLVASDVNQVAPAGTDVAQTAVAAAATFSVPLAKDTANSMLYKKFTVCVMSGGALKAVSNSMYITNPEACASLAPGRMDFGKKGVLPELLKSVADKNQPAALGAKQVNLNIPLSQINRLAGYDYSVMKYNKLGMQVNVIILVDGNASQEFFNPYAYDGLGAHNYYGMNANTAEGIAALQNAASYLAKHYAGTGHGQVDNFIIGNEVNAWWLWNYMNCGSNDAFMQEYAKAFRIMYNGIKSENANANVYTCIDHQWSRAEASYYISGKEFLTKLNSIIKSEGNVDWRVAVHPYNAPLYAPRAWETSKNVSHSQSTPYVTVANIDVLTDFLCSSEMLSSTGAVRSVKMSEVGYVSHEGEELQAASLVYAYLVAENNRYIDGLIVTREVDHPEELAQGLSYGMCNMDGSQKMGFSFYQNASSADIIAQASAIAGVDLTSLITAR